MQVLLMILIIIYPIGIVALIALLGIMYKYRQLKRAANEMQLWYDRVKKMARYTRDRRR
jgi:heme/copper-type cytochrome/quinol oxidase subunit 2